MRRENRARALATKVRASRMTIARGKAATPADSRTPPPEMARFQTVTVIDCATSAASPAALAEAVWNSVGAPL